MFETNEIGQANGFPAALPAISYLLSPISHLHPKDSVTMTGKVITFINAGEKLTNVHVWCWNAGTNSSTPDTQKNKLQSG